MKKILQHKVPFYAAVLLILAVGAGAFLAFAYFREVVYRYDLTLPEGGQPGAPAFQYGSWPELEDVNFYDQVFANLIAEKATFISANLSAMQLAYYERGILKKQFKILAKGKPGSWWETPTGLYRVEGKIPKDFSNFARVYSPWALQFQGNFLIHGWPYYPGGAPVGSAFSGGCIRLSTDDAKTLYDMTNVGTPVLISSVNFQADAFHEQIREPQVEAPIYLAADLKSNFVLAEKNSDEQVPIASLTKLMTALVAVEYVNIEKTIVVAPDMIVKTSIPRLKVGGRYSLYDLLQPLLKESSNEAAVAISNFLGQKRFASLMNRTARSIGMTHTHFADASGSDWNNVSTARDLFLLAQYLYNNRSFILKMTRGDTDASVYGPSAFLNLQNFNVFADDPDFIGGKTGVNGGDEGAILSIFRGTFAGNAAPAAEIPANKPVETASSSPAGFAASSTAVERTFMFTVLKSRDYERDAKNLLLWIRGTYR